MCLPQKQQYPNRAVDDFSCLLSRQVWIIFFLLMISSPCVVFQIHGVREFGTKKYATGSDSAFVFLLYKCVLELADLNRQLLMLFCYYCMYSVA